MFDALRKVALRVAGVPEPASRRGMTTKQEVLARLSGQVDLLTARAFTQNDFRTEAAAILRLMDEPTSHDPEVDFQIFVSCPALAHVPTIRHDIIADLQQRVDEFVAETAQDLHCAEPISCEVIYAGPDTPHFGIFQPK